MGTVQKNSTATKVEIFLQKHVGEKFKLGDIVEQGPFTEANRHAIRQKVEKLIKDKKLKRSAPGVFLVRPAILNGKAKQNGKANMLTSEIQVPAITPQAHDMLSQLQAIQAAQPLDLTAILQAQAAATQHVIIVEQQNRMLHQALDQIIHILEQCGKIEVKG